MNKYFVFRKEAVTAASTTSSDTGVGMSVFAVSADKVAYLSAEKGKIFIAFNDATLYQNVNLFEGDSIQKSSVTIGCPEGEELKFVEDIVNFISGERQRTIMKFDVIDDKSTFKLAELSKAESIVTKVGTRPLNMQTKKVSTGSFTNYDPKSNKFVTPTTIAEIDFGSALPIIDYNHATLGALSHGNTVSTWRNSGTGGSTYNISPGGGTTPNLDSVALSSNFKTDSVQIQINEYFEIPALTVKEDYTIYTVIGTDGTSDGIGPLYGDADGETVGFSGVYPEDGPIEKLATFKDNFSFSARHDSRTGAVARAKTSQPIIGDGVSRPEGYNPCSVYIIRRDSKFNLYLHDRNGEVVAQINSNTRGTNATAGRTDGGLILERLGTVNEITTGGPFKGRVARFGVITQDIGTDNAARLAKDLFNLYTL